MKVVFFYLFAFLSMLFPQHLMASGTGNVSEPLSNSTLFNPSDFGMPLESPEEQLTSGGGGFQPYDFRPGGGGSSTLPLFIMLGNGPSKNSQKPSGSGESSSGTSSGNWYVTFRLPGLKLSGNNQAPGAQEPPPPPETKCDASNYMDFMGYLNQLMEIFNGVVTLVVDKDDTILMGEGDDQSSIREAFHGFVNYWRDKNKLRLIILTRGQLTPGQWGYLREMMLPEPDVLISGAEYGSALIMPRPGTRMSFPIISRHYTSEHVTILESGGVYISKYTYFIREAMQSFWFNLVLQGIPVIGTPSSFWISDDAAFETIKIESGYDLQNSQNQQTIMEALERHLGLLGGINFDFDKNQLILSAPRSKGRILHHLAATLQLRGSSVIVAGDSEDDLSMLLPPDNAPFPVSAAILTGATNAGLVDQANAANTQRATPIPLEIEAAPALLGVLQGMGKALFRIIQKQNR